MTKLVDGKQTTIKETKRHIEEREQIIKEGGIEKLQKLQKLDPKRYGKLDYLELPKCYKWIWEQFYAMWSYAERDMGGNAVITPRTILDYEECFAVNFTVDERRLILRMKNYVAAAIAVVEGKIKEDE